MSAPLFLALRYLRPTRSFISVITVISMLGVMLGVGVLGGYTTFSAFSLEVALFVERGALAQAGLYSILSVMAGLAGLFAGLAVTRAIG